VNEKIRLKIEEYKKMAKSHSGNAASKTSRSTRTDSLSQVIRSKKDADDFMAELESAFQRAK